MPRRGRCSHPSERGDDNKDFKKNEVSASIVLFRLSEHSASFLGAALMDAMLTTPSTLCAALGVTERPEGGLPVRSAAVALPPSSAEVCRACSAVFDSAPELYSTCFGDRGRFT